MHRKFIVAIVAIGLLWAQLHQPSAAQHVGGNLGPCPGGSAPVNGTCGSPSNAYPNSPAVKPEVWRDRYGAIAATRDNGIVGVSNDQVSARAAKKQALKKCAERDCEVVTEYANGCGAVAWGKKSSNEVRAYSSGAGRVEAESNVLQSCVGAGASECVLEYMSCSLPVRVQ